MKSGVIKILLDNNLCVLCTCKNNIPNSSLMFYICDNRCTKMYMLTLKESTKYLNIINNTNVSLLIDTRDNINDKTTPIKALTISGEASIVDDKDTSKKLIDQIIKKHDKLLDLASNKNVCVVQISIKSVLLLESVDKSRYISLTEN
jgi:general stress protein 26